MNDGPPQALTPAQATEFRRRRRARNWATVLVLFALAILFFAITVAKMSGGTLRVH